MFQTVPSWDWSSPEPVSLRPTVSPLSLSSALLSFPVTEGQADQHHLDTGSVTADGFSDNGARAAPQI